MIQLFTHKVYTAILISVAILLSFWFIIAEFSFSFGFKLCLLWAEGLLLDYFCFRYGIIGQKTHLPLVLFSILSVLIVPQLSFGDIIYGAVWLGAFFLSFEVRENPAKSSNLMILLGILLGIAQAISNTSVFLILPIFLLIIQSGTSNTRDFLLTIFYFIMVLATYAGLLYLMELSAIIPSLIPTFTFDYTVFNTIVVKLFVPYVILSVALHLTMLNSYRFRYPNKSKIMNYTILLQAGLGIFLVIITANADLLIYAILSISVLLSFAFSYKSAVVFMNAAFASLIFISLMSLYLYQTLIL